MSNTIAPGSSVDVNVKVTALTTNQNVPVTYKTIILKKNLVNGVNTLTQEMMSTTNTKYVIKYDYVLGENITITENCVLEFDGGSFSGNGENKNTITADKTLVIKSDKKCFSNILFNGDCCDNHFRTKWFTNPTKYGDKTYDHSDDLQALFDCGVQNIHFDDGFYYITKKLTVVGNKDFYTDHENNVFAQKVNFESASVPTIYSDTIVTMLEYTFKNSYIGTNGKRSIYLGAIHFICDTPYTEVTQASTEIPIIKVLGEGMLWRADIYISILAPYLPISTPNGLFNALNYTGIEFYSHTGYMTCIRLYGDIIRTYNGYRAFTGSNTWFTLIELFGYTDCVRGIDTDVEPLIVHNGHQANTALEIFGNEGYFSAPSIYDDESFVFDLAHGTDAMGDRNVWYKCYPSRGIYIGSKTIDEENFNGGKHIRSTEKYPQGVSIPYTEIADKTLSNILYLLTSADNDAQNGNVFTWSYKINNVDIASFTEGTIYNIDKLFTKGIKGLPSDINYDMKFISNAYVVFSEANKLQKIEFSFKAAWVYLDYFRVTNDILYKASTTGTSTCVLEIFDDNDNLVATVNMDKAHNSGFLSRVNLMNYFLSYEGAFNFKFTVTFTASPAVITLPFFALTKWGELRDVDSLGSIFRLPRIPNNTRKGFNYYDTVLGTRIYWSGTDWINEKQLLETAIETSVTTVTNNVIAGILVVTNFNVPRLVRYKDVIGNTTYINNAVGIMLNIGEKYYIIAKDDITCSWAASAISGGTTEVSLLKEQLKDFDGEQKTSTIITTLGATESAAKVCSEYYPSNISSSDATFGQGKWHLPSTGELIILASHAAEIDKAMQVINGTAVGGKSYWSSTEHSASNAYYFDINGGYFSYDTKTINKLVRPIITL